MKRSVIIITKFNYSPWITNIVPQSLKKEMHPVSAIKQTVYQGEGRGLNYRKKELLQRGCGGPSHPPSQLSGL